MSVPGGNILKQALRAIKAQTVGYVRYAGKVTQTNGIDITSYAPVVSRQGSWQPVSRQLAQRMGLEWQKGYVQFFTVGDVLDIERDVSGDQITYCGTKYQVLSATPWDEVDGWIEVLIVRIGPANA